MHVPRLPLARPDPHGVGEMQDGSSWQPIVLENGAVLFCEFYGTRSPCSCANVGFSSLGSGDVLIISSANLDGFQKQIPFSVLLQRPDLRHRGSNLSRFSELYVTAQLWSDSKPLTVAVQTPYKIFKNSRQWNEWLNLPIKYSTIPLNSQLAITVWDLSPTGGEDSRFHAIPFGGTTIPLFDKDNTLQKGRQRCYIHRHKHADGFFPSSTPSVPPPARGSWKTSQAKEVVADETIAELERLEALMKKHEMGEIPANPWLDQMVFRRMERLERAKFQKLVIPAANNGLRGDNDALDGSRERKDGELEGVDDGVFYLYIEFPKFDHPIVFTDREYPAPPISTLNASSSISDIRLKPPPEVSLGPGIEAHTDGYGSGAGRLVRIYDPEVGIKENPAENKHRRLVRSHRSGVMDRDLRPNAKIRDELNAIMAYGPGQELKAEERDLVWKFRHHLTRDKRALVKFVKSVSWSEKGEARQAVQLLPKWTEIDIDDALELLGPSFDNPSVRAYAVDRLRKAPDDELLVYLLQLVQALKFEPSQEDSDGTSAEDSSLARFLITRAARDLNLGTYLHWYLMVECDDRTPEQGPEYRKLFAKVEYEFMTELMNTPHGPERRRTLLRQGELVTILTKLSKDLATRHETRPRKIERLKKFLADPKNELTIFEPPLPLFIDPGVSITGCYPEESSVFKSSLSPLLIHFKTDKSTKYSIIFKTGDDLRQDQLVIQIITLMDRLLQKENLDLKLSPYRILATSTFAGAVQYVPSTTLAAATAKYKGSLLAYLRANNPDDSAPLRVRKEAMDTYVKSCAGYCVITYLLGVGDRHLDNLLLAPDGHFFHADFGYILGRDPKPFAPLMKLSREMVEGMGGSNHAYYAQFKQYCYTAFTTLRKSSNLILNLFALMQDANIPDIRIEPDKSVFKVKERFWLELSEEEAIRRFEVLIEEQLSAVMGAVIDKLHGFVQNLRA